MKLKVMAVFLFGVIAMFFLAKYFFSLKDYNSEIEAPIFTKSISVSYSDENSFLEKIKAFASENNFSFRVGILDPDGKMKMIQLRDDDFKIFISNQVSSNGYIYEVVYYNNKDKKNSDDALKFLAERFDAAITKAFE